MSEYLAFVENGLSDLKEGEELELNIQSLEPGHYKYEAKIVIGMVSSKDGEYPDKLWIRFPKGQMHKNPWSIKIIREVDKIANEFK